MNKKSIWWRLTPVMFWLSVASVIAGIAWKESKWEPPVWTLPVIILGMYFPNLYLAVFSLWHWKYRYRGAYPVAWAALFPLFSFCLPTWLYFGQHIQYDLQGKKQYADLEPLPGIVLPSYYNSLRSVCFVLGGALVGWSAFAVALATPTFFILFNKCDQSVAKNVGKVLTAGEVQAFHIMHTMYQLFVFLMCTFTVCCALGCGLLLLANSIRWRLKEQQERLSLNPPEQEIDREMAYIAKARLAELRSGGVNPVSGEEVFAKIQQCNIK